VSGPPDLSPEVAERVVAPSAEAFRRVVEVMAQLREPGGCPWDAEQTHASLARHLLEETYETLEAIDSGDLESLRDELGDLVLQVVFHSKIASEEGAFTVSDVLDALREKLIRRHPHVFGDVEVSDADQVVKNWEHIKRSESEGKRGVLSGIPRELPALARAAKVYRRAVGVGFSFESLDEVLSDLEDEIAELKAETTKPTPDPERVAAELGDVMFSAVCVGQRFGIEAESSLRTMLERFTARFFSMEAQASQDGKDLESLSADEWRRYWEQAKREQTS
jgi:tetrapyrrole methylase family protein / MazG family protein